MSWADWLATIGTYASVDATESAIYTAEGAECCAGANFKISPEEFKAIHKAIAGSDGSSGRMINGKKYLPVGRVGDGQGNFKMGKDTFCINVGPKYVVFLKVKPDCVCETVVTHCNALSKSLHQ